MLYSTLMLMMSSAFLMLRLSPGGSFPRPLSEAEERKYLEAWLHKTIGGKTETVLAEFIG